MSARHFFFMIQMKLWCLSVLSFATRKFICIGNEEKYFHFVVRSSLSGVWLHSSFHSTLAVRITDDHFRHPECYTCTDCGLNLRMRGHFWVGDVMYCEKHAKERHQGPGSSPQATVSPRQWVCNSTSSDSVMDLGMGHGGGHWSTIWHRIFFSDHI